MEDKILTKNELEKEIKSMKGIEHCPVSVTLKEYSKAISTPLSLYTNLDIAIEGLKFERYKREALEKRVDGLIKKLEDKVLALRTHCTTRERTPEAIQWVKGKIAGTNEVITELEKLKKGEQ
jgi:hypothetical protein